MAHLTPACVARGGKGSAAALSLVLGRQNFSALPVRAVNASERIASRVYLRNRWTALGGNGKGERCVTNGADK